MVTDVQNATVSDLIEERDRTVAQIAALTADRARLSARLQVLESEIAKRTAPAPEPRLSDHALLRWLERVKGVDVEAARREIMTPQIIEALENGVKAITINGVRFVCRDATIVTTVEKSQPARRRKMHCDRTTSEADDIAEQLAEMEEGV